jgi:trans-aconitate methyltransferase
VHVGKEMDGYEACRLAYAEVTAESYIYWNVRSEGYADLETQRLTAALGQLPASTQTAGYVAELGSGYGRNWPLLKQKFPEATVLQFEQSPANLWIAVSLMDVPVLNCHCKAIQGVNWQTLAGLFDVVVDWWTLSYLEPSDISKVLLGVRQAIQPAGFFVLCLPVIFRQGMRSGPSDVGMTYRTPDWYEAHFKAAGLVSYTTNQSAQYYPAGKTADGTEYGREAVWILTPGS